MKPVKTASKRSEFGFSLLELMIVVSIISIVIVAVAPFLFQSMEKARVTACKANLKTIDTVNSIERVQDDKGAATVKELVDKGYLREMPKEPFDGYYSIKGEYAYCSEGHSY